MYQHQRATETGFTLIELMIVVAVIAILAAIAYPSYTNYVESARRSDGQATLLEVMQAEERHYTLNNTYTTDLDGVLGFAADPVESDEGWYDISAAACGSSALTQCVQLTAAPQGAQASDDCGSISLNSRGQWTRTGSASAAECY